MASLYQRPSSSVSRVAAVSSNAASMARRSTKAPEQQRGVVRRIDVQAHATPFDAAPLAGHKIFDGRDAPPRVSRADFEIAEVKPELARALVERNRHRDGIAAIVRLFDEADHLAVIDRHEAQVAGLLQRRIVTANSVES